MVRYAPFAGLLLAGGCSPTVAEWTTWTEGGATATLTAESGAVVFEIFEDGIDPDDPDDYGHAFVRRRRSIGAAPPYAYDFTIFALSTTADVLDCNEGVEDVSLAISTEEDDGAFVLSMADSIGEILVSASPDRARTIGGEGIHRTELLLTDPCMEEPGLHTLELDWSFAVHETVEIKSTF